MRGGFVHNWGLIDPLDRAARQLGCRTRREAAVTVGDRTCYADLLIDTSAGMIMVEAELSPKRIGGDLAKAAAVKARELWIIVPSDQVARAIHRKLAELWIRPNRSELFIFTRAQALARLKERFQNCFSLLSGANDAGKQIKKGHSKKWKSNGPT